MKLTDLNRDGGIGANSLFVQIGELNVLVDCGLHPREVHRGQLDAPHACLQPGRQFPVGGHHDSAQVEPIGQRGADRVANLVWVASRGERHLKVLRLAASPRGCGVRVRDAWVR